MSSASQVPLPGPGAELKRDVSGDARLEWLIAAARVVLLLPGLAVVHRNDGSTALQRMIVEKPAAAAGAPQHAPTATKPAGMARPAQGPPPAPSKAAVRSARVLKRHERNASRLRIFQEETPQARQERRQRRQSRQQQQDHGVGDGMGEQIELDLTAAAAAADAVACRAAAAAVIASAYHQWSAVRRKRARDDASSVMEAAPTAPERLAAPPTPTASVPPGLGLDSTLVPPPASPLRAASPTPAEPPGDGRPSGYGARRSNLFRTPPSSPRRDRSPVASPPSELPPASLPPLPPPSLPAPPPAQHGTPTRPSPARSTWGDADSDDDGPSPPSPTYVPPHLRGRARPPRLPCAPYARPRHGPLHAFGRHPLRRPHPYYHHPSHRPRRTGHGGSHHRCAGYPFSFIPFQYAHGPSGRSDVPTDRPCIALVGVQRPSRDHPRRAQPRL